MVKNYVYNILNLFFPLLCLGCKTKIKETCLCRRCQGQIEFLMPPLCAYCSNHLKPQEKNICRHCRNKPYPYDRILGVTAYKEPLISLIRFFKYKSHRYLAHPLASLLIEGSLRLGFDAQDYDYVTCVPLHKYKLKTRGYNQSELLARLFAKYFKIPFKNDIIYNTIYRPSQTKLSKDIREQNVENVFQAKGDISDKNIVLIDDIFTTGATAASCCRELKKKGAKNISVIALCRAQ